MKLNLMTRVFGSIAMLGVLSAPASSQAGDYVKESIGLFGIRHTTTHIHTEPRLFYNPQRFKYVDECGRCRTGVTLVPQYREVITSKCKTSHIHLKERPCATYSPCNSCYSTSAQQPMNMQPQYMQPGTESILAPVPQTRQN